MAVLQKCLRYDGKLSVGSNMWGDFNFKLNPRLDSLGSSPQNKPLPKKVKTLMEEVDIIDVWRDLHPKSRGYIHYSNPHSVYSIIDYVLYLLQTDLK